MPADSKMGKGSGTVTAVDAASGKITLDHGAIPAVGWPAMKMGFSAKPDTLKGVAVGDKVDFDVTVTGSAGEVTAIKKQ
jgi:Cu/Ag efflux protein CusF